VLTACIASATIVNGAQAPLAIRFAKLFSTSMPERLARIILISPPTVFRMLLTAARTLAKLTSVSGATAADIGEALVAEHDFPRSAAEWFVAMAGVPVSAPGSAIPKLSAEARGLLLPGLRGHFCGEEGAEG